MKLKSNKQIDEILDIIDRKLALDNIPLNQRSTLSAIEFVTDFVIRIEVDGKEIDDFKTDYYEKEWFKQLYKHVRSWYCLRYGEVLNQTSSQSVIGVVTFYCTPFKIVVPLSVRGKIEEPGKSAWFTFPNSVLKNEDVIEWLTNPPNLNDLSSEVINKLYSELTFVGKSLREIHVNLITADKQNEAIMAGMISGIMPHLERAAKDILDPGKSGVTYAFWELHLAVEKSIKVLLLQHGSKSHHHHDLEVLFKKARDEYNITIDDTKLSNLPSSNEAIKYRYGETQGTTIEYAISIYKDVLNIVSHTTKLLNRQIIMNNASFLLQIPPWIR